MLKNVPNNPKDYPFQMVDAHEIQVPDQKTGKRVPQIRYVIQSTTASPEEVARFPYLGSDDMFVTLTAQLTPRMKIDDVVIPEQWHAGVDVVTRTGRLRRGMTKQQQARLLTVVIAWVRSSATGKLAMKDAAEVVLS